MQLETIYITGTDHNDGADEPGGLQYSLYSKF
jgi:hypothetical protein